jgi:hypothetical protein
VFSGDEIDAEKEEAVSCRSSKRPRRLDQV